MSARAVRRAPRRGGRRIGDQALHLAVAYARKALDASGLILTWLDGPEPGDVGLPLSAPVGWGLAFQLKLEREMARKEEALARSHLGIQRKDARTQGRKTAKRVARA